MPKLGVAAPLLALTIALPGCGEKTPTGGAAPTAGAGAGDAPGRTLTFTFGADGLTPARAELPVGDGTATVEIAATDGRPHAVVIQVGPTRTRIVASPGATQRQVLRGLRPGRYRVVPDGATDPAVIVVR